MDYVLYLMPGQEKAVARSLITTPGIRCYCPLRFELKRPRHAKLKPHQYVVSTAPLFPGYLFAGFTDRPLWDVLQLTPGVLGIVSAHGSPLAISEVELDRVRAVEEEYRVEELGRYTTDPTSIRPQDLRPGAMVEITSGFFKGQKVTVVDTPKSGQVTVMAVLFGRDAPTKINVLDLRAAK